MAGPVLFVAADAREFAGVLKRVRSRPLDWGLRFACEGEWNGGPAIFVADGPGMQLAGAATDVARRNVRPGAVVSTGCCGALDEELKLGDVLIATTIIDHENGGTFPAREPAHRGLAEAGRVLSLNRVASVQEKRRLRSTGARAVEMEAAAVARRARIWDVPFYCVRAVSDTAAQGFAMDFNRMRDAAGRFSRPRIVASALVRPWSRIPSLLSLHRGSRMAAESLGEFFADCRF